MALPLIMIVEDDESLQLTLADVLRKKGYEIVAASTGEEALALMEQRLIDLVLLDIKLPDMDGFTLLKLLKDKDEDLLIIAMTAYPDVQMAVTAMKMGAFDYIIKPFPIDEVRLLIEKALETQKLRLHLRQFQHQREAYPEDTIILGDSPKIQAIRSFIERISQTPRTPVLIQGESGTGKELAANSIHYYSARRDKPLMKINCSAIPGNLLESELFGYEKGAFTDAKQSKKGLLELANEGSVFLDEIGELKLELQPKLLRVLEDQGFRRLGGTKDIKVDIRIISSTNRDLRQMVGEGLFREDLYYRLKVMVIEMPPLRERGEDILLLARFFLQKSAQELRKKLVGFAPETEKHLTQYSWPGNVRELKNVIERAAILATGEEILPEHLSGELLLPSLSSLPSYCQPGGDELSLEEMEKAYILHVLAQSQDNKSEAARRLKISRSTLREKLSKYGLQE